MNVKKEKPAFSDFSFEFRCFSTPSRSDNAHAFFKVVIVRGFFGVFVPDGYRDLEFIAFRESELFGEIFFFIAVQSAFYTADDDASETHSLGREGDVFNRYARVDFGSAESRLGA